jgi:acetyl esterase/lipase
MPSPELQSVAEFLRGANLFGPEVTVGEQRANWELGASMTPVPDDVDVTPVEVGGVAGEWVTAPGSDPDRVLLHLHGGGYVIGGPATHREVMARISAAAGARVLLLDYRLAPEHPHPAALEDALAAYRALIGEEGVDPRRTALTGDSAGGGLAVATALALHRAGDRLPAALVAVSPWVDLTCRARSIEARAPLDPVLSPGWLRTMADHYLAGVPAETPTASPLLDDLRGLPPLLVLVGSAEILHDDAIGLFEKAAASDVDSELEVFPDCIHLWMQLAPSSPEAAAGVAHLGSYLRSRLG